MIVDKLVSVVEANLSDLTTASMSKIGSGAPFDFSVARNNGLLSNPYGPGWLITVAGGTSGSASTLNLRLITSAASNLGSPVVLWTLPTALTLAQTVKHQLFVPVPSSDAWLRYAAFQGQAGTAVFTGGKISVEFVANNRNWRAYPATQNN